MVKKSAASVHLTAAVPSSLREGLRRRARAARLSESELVRRLLREGLDRLQTEDLLARLEATPPEVMERQLELARVLDALESRASR
ncbi:MAG: ribbon-helix-helix protein, CopG family [Myxococcota bacterium]